MMREYIEKNMPEMVRCLKQLVSIPGVFDEVSFKGAPFGKNIQKISGVCAGYRTRHGISG